MNPELLLKFMSQDKPWAFGLRRAANMPTTAETAGLPFFASVVYQDGNTYTVIGEDLEECIETCLSTAPAIPAHIVESGGPTFVTVPKS